MPSAWEWFETAAEHLSRFGHRWCRAGALAALDYRSVPRMTTDADLLVGWTDELQEHLRTAGYELQAYADPGEQPHLLINRTADLGNVDFIVAGTEYQELALERAIPNRRVLTAEDVLVHKLIAWRLKDRDDIRSIWRPATSSTSPTSSTGPGNGR